MYTINSCSSTTLLLLYLRLITLHDVRSKNLIQVDKMTPSSQKHLQLRQMERGRVRKYQRSGQSSDCKTAMKAMMALRNTEVEPWPNTAASYAEPQRQWQSGPVLVKPAFNWGTQEGTLDS